jgi:formylglycine-generating enzyme required for sulfatase activity
MALIRGGTFTMGSSPEEVVSAHAWCRRLAGDECRLDFYEREQPARRVRVSDFWLDRTEATHADFAAFLSAGMDIALRGKRVVRGDVLLAEIGRGYAAIVRLPRGGWGVRTGMDRRPVVGVTWDGADRFCAWKGKRLPTEAEWELAARSRGRGRFPWGDAEPTCDGVVLARSAKGACASWPGRSEDVGLSRQDRSAQGVTELAGNVAEWVRDRFADRYDAACDPCEDPVVDPPQGETPDFRVGRGGWWHALPESARASARLRLQRALPYEDVGLRCAASPPSSR